VPVPPAAPALIAMMTYYLFRGYRILGGSRSGGCETPVSIQFFEHISRPKIHGVRNSSGCPKIIVVTLGFMENDNPVCIRAGCHIVDAPYIGGFGENLLVDQHSIAREPCGDAKRDDVFF